MSEENTRLTIWIGAVWIPILGILALIIFVSGFYLGRITR
jgi:hypothetical protein